MVCPVSFATICTVNRSCLVAQPTSWPAYPESAQTSRIPGKQACNAQSSGFAPSRSCMPEPVTQNGEQQPAGVDGDMAFAAVDAFAGVVAAAGPGDGLGAAQRLRVDQRRGGLRVTAFDLLTDLFTQMVVHPVEDAVGGPGLEVVVDEFWVREVGGQRVPLAAGPVEVADRVDHVAARIDDRAAAACPCRDVRGQDRPLGVAGIGRVMPWPGSRQVDGESGRGARHGGPSDKVYRQGWAFGVRASG